MIKKLSIILLLLCSTSLYAVERPQGWSNKIISEKDLITGRQTIMTTKQAVLIEGPQFNLGLRLSVICSKPANTVIIALGSFVPKIIIRHSTYNERIQAWEYKVPTRIVYKSGREEVSDYSYFGDRVPVIALLFSFRNNLSNKYSKSFVIKDKDVMSTIIGRISHTRGSYLFRLDDMETLEQAIHYACSD